MPIVPTTKTALIAGAWSAFGLVPFDVWMSQKHLSVLESNLLWLCALLVFVLVPFVYFVNGRETEPFHRTWFVDTEERARYWVVVKRMLFWLQGALIFGVLWSVVLSIFS